MSLTRKKTVNFHLETELNSNFEEYKCVDYVFHSRVDLLCVLSCVDLFCLFSSDRWALCSEQGKFLCSSSDSLVVFLFTSKCKRTKGDAGETLWGKV